MIFANKQDLPSAIKKDEVIEMMGLSDFINMKPISYVRVQEASAVQDIGLYEGFSWVVDKIVELNKRKASQL